MEQRPKCTVLVIGAPGAGKGTFAQLFVEQAAVAGVLCPHISTGDLLRRLDPSYPHASQIKELLEKGELISDGVMYNLLRARIARDDTRLACLIDGMPRTLPQAEWMVEHLQPMFVFHLDTPDEAVVDRLRGRLTHLASGRSYNENVDHLRPKQSGLDDVTGDQLVRRPEDAEPLVRRRLEIYHQQTAPVLDHLRSQARAMGLPVILRLDGSRPTPILVEEALPWVLHRARI